MPPSSPLAATIVKSFDRSRFDQNLQDLEAELENFKLRYQGFLDNWEAYQALQGQIQSQTQTAEAIVPEDSPQAQDKGTALEQEQRELQQEYDRLRQCLQDIETQWEAQFFSWAGFGTVFWQVVRFLGLGLVLGWWLRGCAG
ncbi:MAG: hypothetical protein ACO3EZ_09550 [Prochlorotrichaceae cyanobacterium]